MLKRGIVGFLIVCNLLIANDGEKKNLNFAVEYTSHATSYYYAEAKGLFKKNGIDVNDVKVYVSGAAVATAFVKEHFDVAYMCLVPAIITYVNGGVPIKIIAGTHKDGYGVVVNSAKIKTVQDLGKEGIKIGVGPKGTVTSFIQEVLIEKANLDAQKVRKNFLTMNSSKQIMALKSGLVDAVVLPEHFATLASHMEGMSMLVSSQDLWKDLQGSVIVVSDKMLQEYPKTVTKLKQINQEAIDAINKDNDEASIIVAKNLNVYQDRIKNETKTPEIDLSVTPEIAKGSIKQLGLTSKISEKDVQEVIDKMVQYGFIKKSFDAKEILVVD
ncbi:ABC transporter substrate-binding protein [Sulfurospirillum deleyianum]|uniref:ABC-type nitrate/sulfonate/bicarbonate transport systems periplasmic components-like protein n=1 Tax=Sulfurospirillum deleyianum (strain ATCC 51133 / DSM 6946 / 5175) TaxID=525898 RepID=D1B3R0_SULD5|nr:ABC transporter substrate-binding protein [Sulfurospirillum deleyianum]ACZ12730.1 ABC-type nitrate/sulfonate/bicarbonate transport systems periplasmic components-like protein [Sulfurospirillum deleyianum DSM 6946]